MNPDIKFEAYLGRIKKVSENDVSITQFPEGSIRLELNDLSLSLNNRPSAQEDLHFLEELNRLDVKEREKFLNKSPVLANRVNRRLAIAIHLILKSDEDSTPVLSGLIKTNPFFCETIKWYKTMVQKA